MRRVVTFAVRLGVFVFMAYIQHLMTTLDTDLLQLNTRMLLSSCQVFIFQCMLAIYFVCVWIFEILNTSRLYNNVLAEADLHSMHEENVSEQADRLADRMADRIAVKMEDRIRDRVGEKVGDRIRDKMQDRTQDRMFPESDNIDMDAPSIHLETASCVSRGLIASKVVIFPDRQALSNHILRVYCVGFLLWTTVYCFNYTVGYILFHTSTGFVLGFMLHGLFARDSILTYFYYILFCILTVIAYLQLAMGVRDVYIASDVKDVTLQIVIPILVGMAWSSELMFGAHNKFCRSMASEAFPICVLCVLPVLVASPSSDYEYIFQFFTIEMYLLTLIVEPMAKFLAIYTMVVSIQTKNTLDVVIAVVSVAHGQFFMHSLDFGNALQVIQLILLCILLLMRVIQYCFTDAYHLFSRQTQHRMHSRDNRDSRDSEIRDMFARDYYTSNSYERDWDTRSLCEKKSSYQSTQHPGLESFDDIDEEPQIQSEIFAAASSPHLAQHQHS